MFYVWHCSRALQAQESGVKLALQRRHKNSGRPPEKDAPKFKEWLRKTHDCAFINAGDCAGKIESMHLDFAGGKGMGTKVADSFCLPACAKHHGLQHVWGWITFLSRMGLTKEACIAASDKLWRAWPGRAKWEAERG
jgi:hypothetical protein